MDDLRSRAHTIFIDACHISRAAIWAITARIMGSAHDSEKIESCKFSCDGEGWQRQARVWTSSNPLILLSDVRLACPPRRSDHRKIYRRGKFTGPKPLLQI